MARRAAIRAWRNLHHTHASAQASRLELHELHMHWRGEGGTIALKTEIAHRMAVCWNVLEGIPTRALERGLLRELVQAVADGDLRRAQQHVDEIERSYELVDGRPHSCESCIAVERTREVKRG